MQASAPFNPRARRRKAAKKHPASTGVAGNLDSRRWVIAQLRNNGATDAQFPLPVTHNGQRVVFNRDELVIVPAYYLDILDDAALVRYEEVAADPRSNVAPGELRSTDQAKWVGLKYAVMTYEIPEKYQTIQGIWEFAELLQTDEELPPELEPFWGARLGQESFTQQNDSFSKMMEAKLNPKAKAKTTRSSSNANSNT